MTRTGSISFVFPGQGVQRPGMGRDFFDGFDRARSTFHAASEALDLDMARLCFEDDGRLGLTEYTQPAILTVEMAILRVLASTYGLHGEFFAGHSLGEYTALCAAGVIEFEDALRIVRERGRLMQNAVPAGVGAMAAVIQSDSPGLPEISAIAAANGADVANHNSVSQSVISGRKEAVERTMAEYAARFPSARLVLLDVSAPFHSKMMQPIAEDFRAFLRQFPMNLENAPCVLSNASGTWHTETTLLDDLVRQISAPVRWLENMEELCARSSVIYEIGPWKVLTPFFAGFPVQPVPVYSVRTMKSAAPAVEVS